MKRPLFTVTNLAAAAGALFAGYIFVTSLPDLRRYIRISTMWADGRFARQFAGERAGEE